MLEGTADERQPRAPGGAQPPATAPDGHGSPPATRRLPALDGLRGVAAIVVLVFHVLSMSRVFDDPDPGFRPAEASWWLTHTPLYLLWAGPQAVLVFFVLSGFVLALPGVAGPVRWRGYYPQRLIRLYLPVWGSLLLAVVLAALVPREPRPGLSQWYANHVPVQGAAEVLRDGALVFGTGWINSSLWSLQWEVLFSLLLPLYLVGARLLPRLWPLKLGGLVGLVAVAAAVGLPAPVFLSMFAFGVLFAFERDRVAALGRWAAGQRSKLWLLVACCVALLTVRASLRLFDGTLASGRAQAAATPLEAIGACLAVVLALRWRAAITLLSSPWAQWLGTRSFSLYLVHEPLAVSSGVLWPGLPVFAHLAIVLPVSLAVAHLFHRVAEVPAHRLSRAAARALR